MDQIIQSGQSKTNDELRQFDTNLNELVTEAELLFDLLDMYSSRIRSLEKELQKMSAHFPFKLNIEEGKKSILKPPLDRHIAGCAGIVHGFWTKDYWYLSWEHDNVNNFRLFLTVEEKELVFFDMGCSIEQVKEFCSQIKFKKPLIETELQIRLRYSQGLKSFINAFKLHLHQYRLEIETSMEDDLPF